MFDERIKDLSNHRLQVAEEKLAASKALLDMGFYKDSIGRSYYAIFTATRAVLALRQLDFAKHSAVIACFQKDYIKTGVFDKEYSKIIMNAFQIRNKSDYDDFYIALKSDAQVQYEEAEKFVEQMKKYIIHELEK